MQTTRNLRVLLAACVIVAVCAEASHGRPYYYKLFRDRHPELSDWTRKVKCNVCHQPSRRKIDHNPYGAALKAALGQKNVRDEAILAKAFLHVEQQPTFRDRLAQKMLPFLTNVEIKERARMEAARKMKLAAEQAKRAAQAAEQLAAQYVGRLTNRFSVKSLDGKEFSSDSLDGQVTVLHFWEYTGESLKSPYGQVGYLDHFYQTRRADGVRVLGVAVDERLTDDRQRPAALHRVRRFKSFMNLSFPLLLDDGPLLESFGDPRRVEAALPLFVVIGPNRRITHYHAGNYAGTGRGLKELDQATKEALSGSSLDVR